MGRAARAARLVGMRTYACLRVRSRPKMHMGMHSSVHVAVGPRGTAFNRR